MDELRQPPHNIEMERALLGTLIQRNKAFDDVGDFLLPDHFAGGPEAEVYNAIAGLRQQNKQTTEIVLANLLQDSEAVKAAGGHKYFATIAKSVVTLINARQYGEAILAMYQRRCLIELASQLSADAYEGHDVSVSSLVEHYYGSLTELGALHTGTSSAVTLSKGLDDAFERYQRIDRGEIVGASTGFQALDNVLGLVQDGDLVVIGGRPGSGKTAIATTMAYLSARVFHEAALRDKSKAKKVLFFSMEMGSEQLVDRIVSAQTGILPPRQRRHSLSDGQWRSLIELRQNIGAYPLVVDAKSAVTIPYLQSQARWHARAGGVGLIVVDYLQIAGIEAGRKVENRTNEVSYVVRGLKELARSMRCPVIALSQLNRGVEAREEKRPTLSDLRDSGEVEAAADAVIFMYRDEYYLDRSQPKRPSFPSDEKYSAAVHQWNAQMDSARGKAEAIVAKNRHGSTGTAILKFDAARTWFEDLETEVPQVSFGGM